jgi:hypothetical protein
MRIRNKTLKKPAKKCVRETGPDEVALTERAAENGAKRACAFVPLQQAQYPAPVATLRAPESRQLLSMHSHLTKEQKLEKAKKKNKQLNPASAFFICAQAMDYGN